MTPRCLSCGGSSGRVGRPKSRQLQTSCRLLLCRTTNKTTLQSLWTRRPPSSCVLKRQSAVAERAALLPFAESRPIDMPPRRKSAKTADPTNDVETQQSTPSFADSLEQRRRAPSSSFHSFRLQLRDSLQQLTTSMQARRESGATDAPSEDDVVQAVEQIVNSLGRPLPASEEEQWRRDARKTAIDRCLEEMIMNWVWDWLLANQRPRQADPPFRRSRQPNRSLSRCTTLY